jgi:hypothetical protein
MAKAKQVGSWGDIPQETLNAFYAAVEKLREEMIPRDCDGDHPIDVLIVNRMTHQSISYFAVPRDEVYSYATHGYLEVHPDKQQEMTDDTERALVGNVHMASEALERHMRLKQMHNEDRREKSRPFAERIKEACEFCKKRVGFDPNNKGDFYTKTRESYPDFPFVFHSNGERCDAHDVRRAEWQTKHPNYNKPEEPRWCMNPECRCKLPDYDSKKGKKDKNICVNPRCGLDNSKHYPEVADVSG